METENRPAELKELEDYFTALEEDRRNLQNLLEEQKEMYETERRTMERERVHERVEWEREMQEREEALLSTVRIQMDKPVRHSFFCFCAPGRVSHGGSSISSSVRNKVKENTYLNALNADCKLFY